MVPVGLEQGSELADDVFLLVGLLLVVAPIAIVIACILHKETKPTTQVKQNRVGKPVTGSVWRVVAQNRTYLRCCQLYRKPALEETHRS